MLESWRRPSGYNMSWFNLKHMLLLSFGLFKIVECSSRWLPIWNLCSYLLLLGVSYCFGFLLHRWLKRRKLAFTVSSYKKAILITECDNDVGSALAKKMALKGFQVIAACTEPNSSNSIELGKNPNVVVLKLNPTEPSDIKEALHIVSGVLDTSGNDLWALICNAETCEIGEVEWQSIQSMEEIFKLNVLSTVRTVKTFLPLLRRARGRVVLSSHIIGSVASPGLTAFSMSAAAISSLGHGLRRELRKWDVDVTTVHPFQLNRLPSMFPTDSQKISEALKQDYGDDYFRGFRAEIRQFLAALNVNMEQTVDVMYHAITTAWPETNYKAGNWKQLLFSNILDFLPHECADYCFEKIARFSAVPDALIKC